jgi:pimeloyl-ACP methyl ester carboxylesterase
MRILAQDHRQFYSCMDGPVITASSGRKSITSIVHRVIAADLCGHGASDAPSRKYTVAEFADDLAWLCAELNVQRPVVVGHSMGGVIALELAANIRSWLRQLASSIQWSSRPMRSSPGSSSSLIGLAALTINKGYGSQLPLFSSKRMIRCGRLMCWQRWLRHRSTSPYPHSEITCRITMPPSQRKGAEFRPRISPPPTSWQI